ncbi:TPA: histidine phosphatase family protein [Candidatus Micrarchaeota archaeon]|nr:MAG: hypothetical protein AUJ65_01625 [Candidatus Micrarchaeota archaeon CG1_02_51_15]HII39325.1 histidine phosphatase family protein [Candidatus Micrarchaeota archaeon]
MTEFIFIRHGTSVNNEERRVNSTRENDRGLSERGQRQARLLAKALANEEFDAIYSSPFPRALQTASAIAGARKVSQEELLRERDEGKLDGLNHKEIRAAYGHEREAYDANKLHGRMAGRESYADIIARVKSFVRTAGALHLGKVAIVTHGAVIVSAAVMASNDHSYLSRGEPKQTSVTRIVWDGKEMKLKSFGDDLHLEK